MAGNNYWKGSRYVNLLLCDNLNLTSTSDIEFVVQNANKKTKIFGI